MQTIVPVFIKELGGDSFAVGSVPIIWFLGLYLPQLILSGNRFTKKVQPDVLKYGFYHRLMFFIIGLVAVFLLNHIHPEWRVGVVLFLIAITALMGSLAIPVWFHLFSKTVPVTIRGRLMAVRQLIGSGMGVAGGMVTTYILKNVPLPVNFGILFIITFALTMISFIFITKLKEEESEPSSIENNSSKWNRIIGILQNDPNFRMYLVADTLLTMAITSSSFYSVYGMQKFGLDSSYAGRFTTVMMAAMAVGNVLFGFTGDNKGHRFNLIVLSASFFLSEISAVISYSEIMYNLVFVFLAFALAVQGISRVAFVLELSEEHNRQLYISMLNSITGPAILFGFVNASLISFYGFTTMFIVNGALAILAFFVLLLKVKDPRYSVK